MRSVCLWFSFSLSFFVSIQSLCHCPSLFTLLLLCTRLCRLKAADPEALTFESVLGSPLGYFLVRLCGRGGVLSG